MADSSTTIVGSMGRPPELKFTAGGQALCSFTVAVSNRYKPKNSEEWVDEVAWVDCTAWGTSAENIAASCDKGTRVVVVGRLKMDEWDDRETGKKRSKLNLVVDHCGVELRWATAIVEKTERTGGSNDPFP